jgi:hypothetical protein
MGPPERDDSRTTSQEIQAGRQATVMSMSLNYSGKFFYDQSGKAFWVWVSPLRRGSMPAYPPAISRKHIWRRNGASARSFLHALARRAMQARNSARMVQTM